MRARPLIPLLAAAALLAGAPAARAAFFPGDVVDGGPGVSAVQGADLAPDGTGAVAYLRSVGGVEHLFAARLVAGAFQGPERVDAGVPEAASSAGMVAIDGGRLIAAWNAGGRLMTSSRGPQDAGWAPPTTIFDERSAGRTVTNVSLDASIHGVPYVAFTTTGPGGGADVRAARTAGGAWIVDPAPLDVIGAALAGNGPLKRPHVSTNAEGSAFVVWGEDGLDGITHVYGRRVTRNGVATTVREISVPALDGRPSRGADSAEAAQEYDSSYGWVVFRQRFDDGGALRSRALARRLIGSDFEPPVGLDGLAFPAAEGAVVPRIDLDGRGRGLATSVRDATFVSVGSVLRDDALRPPERLDLLSNGANAFAVPAAAENGRAAVAWERTPAPGLGGEIRARPYTGEAYDPEVVVSRPELGSSAAARGLAAAADRVGNTLVAFLQGPAAGRRLVVAVDDRPPGTPRLRAAGDPETGWARTRRPPLAWSAVGDAWGAPTYQVFAGAQLLGQTQATTFVPAADLPEGVFPLRLVAIDRRLQVTAGPERAVRIDTTRPTATISSRVTRQEVPDDAPEGTRPPRRWSARLTVKLADNLPPVPGVIPAPGSGVVRVKLTFGDGTRSLTRRSRTPLTRLKLTHVYRRTGVFLVVARVYDKAGNAAKFPAFVQVK